jgi:hypothetical protein
VVVAVDAFDAAVPSALALGLPVLWCHEKTSVPIGFVKSLKVTAEGLWGSMILPAPVLRSRAHEIYERVRAGLLKFSVGGFWRRSKIGGKTKLMCDRLVEVSLPPCVVNPHSRMTSVAAVQEVKSIAGVGWVPATVAAEVKALTDERAGLEHLAARLRDERQQKRDLEGHELKVARIVLGIRSS